MTVTRQRSKKKRFPKKNKSRIRRLTAGVFQILLGLVILSFLLVLVLRWINPPTSMMMTIRRSEAAMNQRKDFRIDYRWVDWDQIALHLPLAIIASEDQNFPIHHVPNYKKFLTIFVRSIIINNINVMSLKIM